MQREPALVSLLALAVLLVYAGSLASPFLFDDMHVIVHNAYIKSVAGLWRLFTEPVITSVTTILPNMFRPLLMLSYAANYAVSGLNPVGYHLVNVWLHLLNALLLYLFMTRALQQERLVAWWVALLFAVHPLNSQAVIHISSRSVLLVTTWMLLGCLAYHRRDRSARWLTAVAFGAGLLTKEIAVTLPVLLIWMDWARQGKSDWRGWARRLWPCALLLVGYLAWRRHLFGAVTSPSLVRDWWLNLGVACHAIVIYLRLWVAPVDLCLAREVPVPSSVGDWQWWLPVAGYAGLWMAALAALLVRRATALALGLGWFLIALLPSHPIAALNLPAGENHAYLPGIGWWLAFAVIVSGWRATRPQANRRCSIVLGVLAVAWALLTMQRVTVWHDDLRLWTATARCTPHTSGVRVSLAQAYETRGADDIALTVYQHALPLARTPREAAQVWLNVGTLHWRAGRLPQAREDLTRALALEPSRGETYNNLGLVEEDMGHLEEAGRLYTQALAMQPSLPDPSQNLGALALREGRWSDAIVHFRAAIAADPDRPSAYAGLAQAYEAQGDTVAALAVYEQLRRRRQGSSR